MDRYYATKNFRMAAHFDALRVKIHRFPISVYKKDLKADWKRIELADVL